MRGLPAMQLLPATVRLFRLMRGLLLHQCSPRTWRSLNSDPLQLLSTTDCKRPILKAFLFCCFVFTDAGVEGALFDLTLFNNGYFNSKLTEFLKLTLAPARWPQHRSGCHAGCSRPRVRRRTDTLLSAAHSSLVWWHYPHFTGEGTEARRWREPRPPRFQFFPPQQAASAQPATHSFNTSGHFLGDRHWEVCLSFRGIGGPRGRVREPQNQRWWLSETPPSLALRPAPCASELLDRALLVG